MKLTDRPILRGRFLTRPNRFTVRCELERFGVADAFLPNPGRLQELLLPGAELWVADSYGHTALPRKTRFTVVAVARDGQPICLDTHATNRVARFLVETGRVPELATARVVRGEAAVGHHRFDWLLEQDGAPLYLELKSVTLFGSRVADDVTVLPVRSSHRLEDDLADALSKVLEPGPKGFGASDSPQPTHLFYSQEHPMQRHDFHVLLWRFRMPSPRSG